MSAYAVIDQNNVVVNVVEWDGGQGWAPPQGQRAILANSPNAVIGAHYNDATQAFEVPA